MEELPIPGLTPVPDTSASASEDFATIAAKVPSVFMYLSAGYMDERGDAPAHNPRGRCIRGRRVVVVILVDGMTNNRYFP